MQYYSLGAATMMASIPPDVRMSAQFSCIPSPSDIVAIFQPSLISKHCAAIVAGVTHRTVDRLIADAAEAERDALNDNATQKAVTDQRVAMRRSYRAAVREAFRLLDVRNSILLSLK